MSKAEMESAVSTHRHTIDAARAARRLDAVLPLNEVHELLQEKVAVANFAIRRVYVKAGTACRSHDHKFANLCLATKVFDQAPGSTVNEALLVISAPMEVIKDGKTAGLFFLSGLRSRPVKTGWKEGTVCDRMFQDSARHGATLGATLGSSPRNEGNHRQQSRNNEPAKSHS